MQASDKLLKLKSIAERATQGCFKSYPWSTPYSDEHTNWVRVESNSTVYGYFTCNHNDTEDHVCDAIFATKFNPQTAIALIDQMLKMREALEKIQMEYIEDPYDDKYNRYLNPAYKLATEALKETDQAIEDL